MVIRYQPDQKTREKQLAIYTLGRFQVKFGDQVLFNEHTRSHKLGDLFMYLITQQGKQAPSEAILESLWPDQEYANPKNALKNMVYRLKKIMQEFQVPDAQSFILYSYGGYSWNSESAYWLDAEAFEQLCQQARSTAKTDPLQAADRYREALALYRGPYLPECHYSDWVLPRRHYCRQLFVRSVAELLALQKEHKLFSQMTEDCEKVLYIEDFEENFHHYYLEALLQEGKTAQARAHYEYITSLLYQELGAKPSPAMRRIYRAIKTQMEKPDMDFNDLQELLKERDDEEGALLCEPDFFRYLCRLEKRRAERQDLPVHLGIFSLTGPNFQPLPPGQLTQCMEHMQKVLLARLRKGDVIASWNDNQYTVMLPRVNLEQAESVLQRIHNAIISACPKDEVVLRSSVHPILPWE